MNLKKLNETISRALEDNRLDDWIALRDRINDNITGHIDITVEDQYDIPYINVWYDIDNDLHETYDHTPLYKELRELDGFLEVEGAGDGIMVIMLDIDVDCDDTVINNIIDSLNKVRPIIDKYWKED